MGKDKPRNSKIVEDATVTISPHDERGGGRGILVTGSIILTAAHCIDCKVTGEIVLGQPCLTNIETAQGRILLELLALDPVADIAALDRPDIPKESSKFEAFCANTRPVPMHTGNLDPERQFTAWIYTHKGTWVQGIAQIVRERKDPFLYVETEQEIEPGTSGAAIVNEAGELVALASNFSLIHEPGQKCSGSGPRPLFALPVWVVHKYLQPKDCDE